MSVKTAQHGAAWLDVKRPGWHREINTRRLNVMSSEWCVLAQLYGNFYAGLKHIPYRSNESADTLGFLGGPVTTAAWKREIKARRRWDRHPVFMVAATPVEATNYVLVA